MLMDKIEEFFHHISPKIIQLTNQRFEKTIKVQYKDKEYSPNIATEGDLDNEELIKTELHEWFPEDSIIAEETSPDSENINKGRNWIIDPICGSSNFRNGIRLFCTNIALSDNGRLIASLVIDHSKGEYIWSTGNSRIFIGKEEIQYEKKSKGLVVDLDLSAISGQSEEIIDRHNKLFKSLVRDKRFYISSLDTSLSFAYVALGKIDAYASGYYKIWDSAAANFLILQAGGVVTQLNGAEWNLLSENTLAAHDEKLHADLLKIINS